jgi:hypothetical protein
MIELYLLILAISNLISEQSIVRNRILKLFGVENYLNWRGVKRFTFDLLSCPSCLSFWVGSIVALILSLSVLEAIKIGLIAMFIYAVIEKIKR